MSIFIYKNNLVEVTLTMAIKKSSSQSTTYEAIGLKDDYSDIIVNIDPDLTYLLSNLGTAKDAENLQFNWLTEGLKPPRKNANLEMTDYQTEKVGSIERRNNNCQFFVNTGKVSDAQRDVKKVYKETDEFLRQKEIAFKQQARDMEYAIVANTQAKLESGNNPAITGGIPYFMEEETLAVAFDSTTGIVTTTDPHNLETGDFIYFKTSGAKGDVLPADISSNIPYWIQKASDKTFKLFDDLESAIENKGVITLTDNGTGSLLAVKNNIVDAGNALYTENHINDAMQMCFDRGGNPTIALMSGRNKRRFSQIITGGATKQSNAKDKKVQNVTDVYVSDFGEVTAKAHRMYGDKRIDIMDMAYWDLKWFKRPHEVEGLAKKGSYSEFVLEGWFGLQGTQPKASGSITNIKRA